MTAVLLPLLLILHVGVCVLLVIVVLMQRPRSEGLGAAFGGGMTENIFGAQTSHVLAKFTSYLGIIFFVLTLLLAIIYAKIATTRSSIQKELEMISTPLVPPAASPFIHTTPSPLFLSPSPSSPNSSEEQPLHSPLTTP